MKYTALYWAMRFYEYAPDLYRKEYKNGTCVEIDAEKQTVFTDKTELSLNTHESFVVLELLDRLFHSDTRKTIFMSQGREYNSVILLFIVMYGTMQWTIP